MATADTHLEAPPDLALLMLSSAMRSVAALVTVECQA